MTMSAAREKDQADFDLERFIDLFDQALTSKDPRVINALRQLMMMVALTAPETYNSPAVDRRRGPLRQVIDDIGNLTRRIERIEESQYANQKSEEWSKIDAMKNLVGANYAKSLTPAPLTIDQNKLAKLAMDIPSLKNQL